MLNDAHVLARIEEALQPSELSAAMKRLRRVPEVWLALHDAEFLSYVMEHPDEITWTPSAIADCCLMFKPSQPADPEGVEPDGDAHALSELFDLATSAHALAKRINASPEETVERFRANPMSWSSQVCCAWPHIGQPASLIERIVASQDLEMTRLILAVLRANYSTPEVIEVIQANSASLGYFILELVNSGEGELAHILAEEVKGLSAVMRDTSGFQHGGVVAYAQAVSGDYDQANASLSTAWDTATESTAQVADSLAEVARLEGNQAVELEARRQAVEKACTPIRRAALARSLVESDKAYDAYQLVSHADLIEERIAYGMAALGQGLQSEAQTALKQAKNEAIQLGFKDAVWLAWMAEGLESCGAVSETIEIKSYLASIIPHQSSIELELAALWEQAGDPSSAVVHAGIALALAPESIETRKTYAHNLRLNGEAEKALAFFKQVVQEDETALTEYCECALETHQSELASEIASTLVERHPDSAQMQTLLARAKQLQGENEIARSAIEQAIELDASEVEPLLVLADIQSTSGELEAAGETLLQAIQVAPENGKAHYARAQWLALQDRFHEASEHIARAIELNPKATAWIVDHADLLVKKGDHKGARSQLEHALHLQPKNWRVRQTLARSLEESGEIDSAVQLIQDPPADIDDASRIDLGRILVKAGVSGDENSLRKGLGFLNGAQAEPEKEADYLFWSARANEALGNFEKAAEQFENYLATFEQLTDHHVLDAILGYSRVSLAQEKPDQAVAFLQANRGKYPASMDVVQLLSQAHLASGDGKQAFEIAQQAIELNPVSIDARKLMSKTAEALGDIRTAIDAEQEVLAQQPQDGASWRRLAQLYTAIKDNSAARTHLAKAIQIDRHDAKALHHLATLCDELGWADTQLRLMKRAGILAPSDVALQRDLAELTESSGDFNTAHLAWMRCIDESPDDVDLLRRAAGAVSKAGQVQPAIDLWNRVIEQDPEDIDSLVALAETYETLGDPQTGLSYYQQLLDLDVKDPRILTAIARAYLGYGDSNKARSLIERTINQYPDHVGIQLVQVEAYLQSGDGQSALDIVEGVVAQTPPDAYTLGLAALSAIMVGDVQRAKSGLDEALHEAHLPSHAAEILMPVSAALGEWRVYSSLLSGLTDAETSSGASERQALRVLLRARDLEWLHSKALNIRSNKPDAEFINTRLLARIETHPTEAQSGYSGFQTLLQWHDLLETPSVPVESELSQLSLSEQQEFIQAAAIGFLKANRPSKALSMLDQHAPMGVYRGYHALLTSLASASLENSARIKDSAEVAARYVETRACGSYLQGKQSFTESDVESAITAFNAALAIWPDESEWHSELAQVYVLSDRKEAALPHLQQAVELDPQNTDHLISLARAYRAAGEWTQAEAIYARCLQDTPSSAQIWKEAGEVALSNGNAPQAENWFERACSLAPSDAVCLMGSARAALLMDHQKLAVERAQSAYKLAPNEPQVLTGFAEILAAQGKMEKAIQAYDRAIKVSAGDPQVQLARSRLLMKNGQFTDAVNDIKAVIDTDYEDPLAWALLAEAYERASQMEEALSAINRAIEDAPRAGPYRLAQGRIYRKSGQLDQALKVLRELERDEPENLELPGELGQVYEARRETDAALESYLRAVALNAQDVESCMHAGVILKGLKSYDHAAEMFERVVISRPNDAKALHQLAAVRALQLVHGGIGTQVVTT